MGPKETLSPGIKKALVTGGELANKIDIAVGNVLNQGFRTADIAEGGNAVTTVEMGDAVIAALRSLKSE